MACLYRTCRRADVAGAAVMTDELTICARAILRRSLTMDEPVWQENPDRRWWQFWKPRSVIDDGAYSDCTGLRVVITAAMGEGE